jgi:hypothetical protein
MSTELRSEVAQPAAPTAPKKRVFFDSADGRYKYIDANGLVFTLTSVEWPSNHLVNGGFDYAQRQVAGTLTTYSQTASRAYTADRWFACNENASIQYQQIDSITAPETGLVHRFYGRYKKITSAGKMLIGQAVTADGSAALRTKRVRLSVKMRRTVAAAMDVRLGLAQLVAAGTHDSIPGWAAGVPSGTFVSAWGGVGTDPTLGTNVSRLTPVANSGDGGTISGNGMTCTLLGSWKRFSACFDVPSDAKNLIAMVWTDGQPAANDELNITEVMLTDGVEIIDWTPPPRVQELDRCNRFYQKSFPIATAPAQNAGLTGSWRGNAANAGAVAIVHGFIEFAVALRAVPTIVLFNPAAVNAFLRYIITPSDATATSATQITERGTEVTATGLAAWIAGGGIAIHWTADAEI